MKRDYASGVKQGITAFTGIEIEHTPAYGMKTLFIVGVQNSPSILEMAGEHYCTHIYLGANQSFKWQEGDDEFYRGWSRMIVDCLTAGYWVTLDFDVRDVEHVIEAGWAEYRRFIPQISVKVPYLTQLGYNATIKIDDIDFGKSNPGVWCHSLQSLTARDAFTDWDKYGKDEVIK